MKRRFFKASVRLAAFALVIPVLAGSLGIMGRSADEPEYYLISRGTDITILTGYELSAEELAERCGYDADEYLFDVTDQDGYISVELYRALDVTIISDGETHFVRASGGTVGELLSRCGIALGEEDILSHSEDADIADGMEIRVRRVTYGEATEEEKIAHATKYNDSKELEKGTEKTLTEGRDGLKRLTYKVRYIDGEEVSRELVSEETVTEPVDTVILRGTKARTTTKPSTSSGSSSSSSATKKNTHTVTEQSGVVKTYDGEELSYSSIVNIKACAYTYSAGSITASGAPVQVGIVAMLRSTLPQGTKVYVETVDGKYTYGPAVVGDIPGGDVIDLFFETMEECRQFGVRDARVYVLD